MMTIRQTAFCPHDLKTHIYHNFFLKCVWGDITLVFSTQQIEIQTQENIWVCVKRHLLIDITQTSEYESFGVFKEPLKGLRRSPFCLINFHQQNLMLWEWTDDLVGALEASVSTLRMGPWRPDWKGREGGSMMRLQCPPDPTASSTGGKGHR